MSAHATIRFSTTILAFAVLAPLATAEECCDKPTSWMFQRSTYSHSPESGARLAQYARNEFVAELPDPRLVTSGYRVTRTDLPGPNGSLESSYQVQSWANGSGGLDAEWERFNDVWQDSFLTGSYFNTPGNDYRRDRHHRRGYGYRHGRDRDYGYRSPRPYRP